jgi:Tfp pilus assembly protein PilZ
MRDRRKVERTRKRMACQLVHGRQRFSGVVLDVSASGLFVQTKAKPGLGEAVSVEIAIPGEREPIRLETSVARVHVVPAQLVTVAQGGVGLRILNAPEPYFQLIGSLQPGRGAHASGAAADAASADVPAQPRPSYRVRATQVGGARSRTLQIGAESPEEAARLACAELGDGWKVLEVREGDGVSG